MGLFSSIIKGVVGAATGGVGGAVLGLAGDLLGGAGGGSSGSASGSGTTSGSSTQQTIMRDWSPAEQTAYNQAMAGLAQSGQPVTPEAEAAIRKRIYDANFLPAQQQIQQGLANSAAQNYSLAARRGAGQTSAAVARGGTDAAMAAREIGLASQNATIAAENQVMAQEQLRMQNVQNYIQQMNALWDARIKGSKIVTTNTGTSSQTQQQSTDGGGLLGGIGYALGNKDSWLNQNVLNRKKAVSSPSSSGKKTTGGLSFVRG